MKGGAVVAPAGFAGGIGEGFVEGGAEFVKGVVKAELGVGLDVFAHGGGEGAEEFAVVGGGGVHVGGVVVGVLAGGEVLGMVAAAGLRADVVDAAAAVFEERAGVVLGGVLEGGERAHFLRMGGEALEDAGVFLWGEMTAEVVDDGEDFVREDIDAQGAADGAAGTAGQREAFARDDPGVHLVEGGVDELGGTVEIVGRESAGEVVEELLDGVVRHRRAGGVGGR